MQVCDARPGSEAGFALSYPGSGKQGDRVQRDQDNVPAPPEPPRPLQRLQLHVRLRAGDTPRLPTQRAMVMASTFREEANHP